MPDYYESNYHLPKSTKMVFCKICDHPVGFNGMMLDEICDYCFDDMQNAKDQEDTYNELNRWVG